MMPTTRRAGACVHAPPRLAHSGIGRAQRLPARVHGESLLPESWGVPCTAAECELSASRHQPKASEHVGGLIVHLAVSKAGGNIMATGCKHIFVAHVHTDHTSKFNEHICGAARSRLRLHHTQGGDGGAGRIAAKVLVGRARVVAVFVCEYDEPAAGHQGVAASLVGSDGHM